MTAGRIPRAFVNVVGVDAQKYLHSQLSNDIASLEVGGSRHSFLLEPTGQVVALVRVTRFDHGFIIDFDDSPGATDAVITRLNRFRIRVKVDIEPTTMACIAFRGEPPVGVEGSVVPAWWGSDFDVLVNTAVEFRDGGREMEFARVTAGWPSMGSEIRPGETLPAATGVVDVAVSFSKGCYPGQELVERMDSRGSTAPRTLRRLAVDPQAHAGDDVVINGQVVGTLTTVVDGRALAYVNRAIELGDVIGSAK